jgi:hypothetical protein
MCEGLHQTGSLSGPITLEPGLSRGLAPDGKPLQQPFGSCSACFVAASFKFESLLIREGPAVCTIHQVSIFPLAFKC